MVGNKVDMRHLRGVTLEEGKRFAEEKNIFFVEASAVESIGVDTIFIKLIEEITNSVIPKLVNETNSTQSGVWPYLPSAHNRTRTLPGKDKISLERSKRSGKTCCK